MGPSGIWAAPAGGSADLASRDCTSSCSRAAPRSASSVAQSTPYRCDITDLQRSASCLVVLPTPSTDVRGLLLVLHVCHSLNPMSGGCGNCPLATQSRKDWFVPVTSCSGTPAVSAILSTRIHFPDMEASIRFPERPPTGSQMALGLPSRFYNEELLYQSNEMNRRNVWIYSM